MNEQQSISSRLPPEPAAAQDGGSEPDRSTELPLLIIVVNFRTPDLTIDCLNSLAPEVGTIPGTHVVVLDNGSGDGSADRIADAIGSRSWAEWVTLLREETNHGFAGGNNRALENSPAARYILLLNSDTVVQPGSLRHCYDKMESNPAIGALGIRQVLFDDSTENSVRKFPTPLRSAVCALGLPWRLPRLFRWADQEDADWDRDSVERDVDWIGGAFLVLRGSMLPEISGLFDTGFFFTGEDVELCHRIWRAGYRCHYDPSVWVRHLHGGSSDPDKLSERQLQAHHVAARYLVQRKCYGSLAERFLWLLDIGTWGLRLLWLGLRGQRQTDTCRRMREGFHLLIRRGADRESR